MSANNDEMMMQFVEMTGTDPTTALYFLEMSNFDLESALNLMFSGDIIPPPGSPTSNSTAANHQEDALFSPFNCKDDEQEQDSVRVADPVKQQVLLDFPSQSQSQRIAMQNNLSFSRAEDPSVGYGHLFLGVK